MRRILFLISLVISWFVLSVYSEGIAINTLLEDGKGDQVIAIINVDVSTGFHLYVDKFKVEFKESDNLVIKEIEKPSYISKNDIFFNKKIDVFASSFKKTFVIEGFNKESILPVIIKYQACTDVTCFLPQEEKYYLSLSPNRKNLEYKVLNNLSDDVSKKNSWKKDADKFEISRSITGFEKPEKFLITLAGKNDNNQYSSLSFISIILILLSGLALNFTPCVLPMIPITISIIGAGSAASSRMKGFQTGFIYASGLSLAYGSLGVISVISGSTFGTLNSSPLFNVIISLVFLFLALSMFGVFSLDFTRFQPQLASSSSKKSVFLVFFMGIVTALLSGACVAPVIISVLLHSTELYMSGKTYGLFLPFILGLGMGLPWPFLGSGISFLPKPGNWMKYVKNTFGIVIILFSLYYGKLGFDLYKYSTGEQSMLLGESMEDGWLTSLDTAFSQALKEDKPVFIDFWASWCKSCIAMNKITFKDKNVKNRLNKFIKVKFNAEKPSNKITKEILKYFNVKGLPTFIVMEKRVN